MKLHRYSNGAKAIAVCVQQLLAVTLFVFLFLIGNLLNKSMLEFQDIRHEGFEESGYFTQEFRSTSTEVQKLIGYRERFERNGKYDANKSIEIVNGISYRLGDLEQWAEEGCSYEAAGYLTLVKESFPATEGAGYIERYLNGEISTQEAINISNAIENRVSEISEEISQYKRLVNKYNAGKSNTAYYYSNMKGEIYTNLEKNNLTKENARNLIEDGRKYLYYDDQDVRLDTNVSGLEDYFYQDVTYITGNMEPSSVFIMGVDTEFPCKDSFYEARASYNNLHPWIKISIAAVIISAVGWVITLIYLGVVTGKKDKQDEIFLNSFDDMKSELFFFWAVLLIVVFVLLLVRIPYLNQSLAVELSLIGVVAFALNGITLAFALSMIRRLRTGTLWTNSILYLLIGLIIGIYEHRRGIRRSVILYIVGIAGVIAWASLSYYYTQPIFLILLAVHVLLLGTYLLRESMHRQKVLAGIEEIKNGNLEYKIDESGMSGENQLLSEGINNLTDGLDKALQASTKHERMKSDLITNVSHDIKTPLTSIINYVNLLERENIENEKVNEYIHVLKEKSARLEQLTKDLVEASKISSGNIQLEYARINIIELVYQTCGEFEEKFEEKKLELCTKMPDEAVSIFVDGRRFWRVLENLYNNVAKYAMEGTRVYVEVERKDGAAVFSIKNISAKPLNIPAEELTERFIRGDVSRSTEGSGLGLSIAENLTTLMGGNFEIILDGDLFKVRITFPLAF